MPNTISVMDDLIFDSIQIGLLIFDQHGDLIKNNGYASMLLTKVCPQGIILSLDDLNTLVAVDWEKDAGTVERTIAMVNGYSLLILKKNLTLATGHFTLIQLEDISGQQRQIETIYTQTSDFLWKIRSRITTVQNALSLMVDYADDTDNEMKKELAKNSQVELWQLERYMDNFRDLSLINGNSLLKSMTIEKIDLEVVIQEAIRNIKNFIHNFGKKVAINIDIPTGFIIQSDKLRTIRIIESLLFNAAIYAFSPVVISLSVESVGGKIVLTITDNGFGISEKDQPNIFTYAFRGENATKTDYNGMGCELFIARHILLHLGAKISFESQKQGGTSFKVEFLRAEK